MPAAAHSSEARRRDRAEQGVGISALRQGESLVTALDDQAPVVHLDGGFVWYMTFVGTAR